MKLLLISNSTNPGEAYLDWPKEFIQKFLGNEPVNALFIPYAAVTFSYDEYEAKVERRFAAIGHHVTSIHHFDDPVRAVQEAKAIVVGGGNTWRLVQQLYQNELIEPIRRQAIAGVPYIGWSAGSNIACPTLRTTNDMPVVDPFSFYTLNLIPFQINPHFLDTHPEGFGGETREDRINEFITINPEVYVLGLREATLLQLENRQLNLAGNKTARLFHYGDSPRELSVGEDLSFLI
ncbi:MAG: dipeptidase PepE [Dysgonamonadaceae bacterium]|jgi:dipeptidase E|nr:dipeptidase PepE [Dysgonamonadaceae bacterium]